MYTDRTVASESDSDWEMPELTRRQPLRRFVTLDDLMHAVGEEIGPSGWATIVQERVDGFAEVTGDRQWIHVDVDRATHESPYGGTISHGYLTLSMIPWFASQLVSIEVGQSRINYGLNRTRFPAPVCVGRRLRASCTIASVNRVRAGHLLALSFVVEVEGEAKPACTAETLTLLHV